MASGTFNLTAEFASISPYTFSMIAGACDSFAAGATTITPMSGTWTDDSATPIAALPFTMRFFGANATHFSANSNGLVQLFPSMMGMASTEYSNAVMATASDPNNIIATFWDDLNALAPTTAVRTATLGTAPSRRFVVQWTDWSIVGDSATRLTFQTKLFEGTGVIEMHYCSLAPMATARVFGSSATVGIENATGTEGVTVTHNAMASISTANAYRLTPR
jgi:hypothetical protein